MNSLSHDAIEALIGLVRRRDYVALRQHPIAALKVVQKRLPDQDEHTDKAVGQEVLQLLRDAVELLKPTAREKLSDPSWRQYILLKEFMLNAKQRGEVEERLVLGRSAFYGVRKDAIHGLASVLDTMEADARRELPLVKHNLPRPPYRHWIRRTVNGENLVDKIIDELGGRAWIVAINGGGGVGKTSAAYRVAEQCSERRDFDAVVWSSAKEAEIDPPGRIVPLTPSLFSPTQELEAEATSPRESHLGTILADIGRTLKVREMLTLPNGGQRRRRALELLATNKCLIVIDNLESLSPPAQDEIFAFLKELPAPSKAIVTSRQRHYVGESVVAVSAMERDEALRFMQVEADTRGLRLDGADLETVYQRTGGVAKAMQYTLGLMHIRGYSAEQAVAPGVEQDALLDYLFELNYEELEELDRRVLHVMPLFAEPATVVAIQAASQLAEALLRVSLGRLYQLFLLDKMRSSWDRYMLPPLVPAYLRSIRARQGLLLDEKPIDVFLSQAIDGLAHYYRNRFERIGRIDNRLAFLKYEKRNVLKVIARCYVETQWENVIALTHEISQPLDILGYWDERVELAEKAIQAAIALGRPWKAAWFRVHDIGWAHYMMGRWAEAYKVFYQAREQAKGKPEYRRVEALAVGNLGVIAQVRGDHRTALARLEESLSLWQEIGEAWWEMVTRARLGRLKYETGALEEALQMQQDAYQAYVEIGHVGQISTVLSDLALTLFAMGDHKGAVERSDDSLLRARVDIEPPAPAYAHALHCRARLDMKRGELRSARKGAQAAISLYGQIGCKSQQRAVEAFLRQMENLEG